MSDNPRRGSINAGWGTIWPRMKDLHWSRTDIVIKPADKGSEPWGLCDRSGETTQWSAILPTTRCDNISAEITSLINQMAGRGSFDTNTKDFLTPLHPRPARFYLLPKIHKPNNPGRPIISSCSAPTEKISLFVDHHLRPLPISCPDFKDLAHYHHRRC